MQFWLENIFGTDDLQWTLSAGDAISSVVHVRPDGERRDLRLEYAPMYQDGAVAKVMVIAKDVTEVKRLEAEMAQREQEHRADLSRAAEIAQLDPELFDTFMVESASLLDASEAALDAPGGTDEPVVHRLFRAMHTLKGNARIFKLTSLQDAAHEIETALARIRDVPGSLDAGAIASLREQLAGARKLLAGYHELGRRFLAAPSAAGADLPADAASARRRVATARVPTARILELRRAFKDLARAVAELREAAPGDVTQSCDALAQAVQGLTMVPLGELLDRFRKMVLDLARELEKRVGDPEIAGAEIEVDTKLIDKLSDVLGHAVRNAIDHGIEAPADRPPDKPEKGRVAVRARWEARDLVIDVEDDGRGVDLDRVRQIALAKGSIREDQADTIAEPELLELLFLPGFTTMEQVTLVSGRGVGLDAIRSTMRALKGDASIRSKRGRGTTLTLRIPADYYQQL
jgi:chemotaxis protein histidine kinase CheA